MKTTTEGGGFVVTCACRWLRFEATETGARDAETGHAKKCKKASEPVVSRAFWDVTEVKIGAESGPESAATDRGLRPVPVRER